MQELLLLRRERLPRARRRRLGRLLREGRDDRKQHEHSEEQSLHGYDDFVPCGGAGFCAPCCARFKNSDQAASP
jgi:hypothetical protein